MEGDGLPFIGVLPWRAYLLRTMGAVLKSEATRHLSDDQFLSPTLSLFYLFSLQVFPPLSRPAYHSRSRIYSFTQQEKAPLTL